MPNFITLHPGAYTEEQLEGLARTATMKSLGPERGMFSTSRSVDATS